MSDSGATTPDDEFHDAVEPQESPTHESQRENKRCNNNKGKESIDEDHRSVYFELETTETRDVNSSLNSCSISYGNQEEPSPEHDGICERETDDLDDMMNSGLKRGLGKKDNKTSKSKGGSGDKGGKDGEGEEGKGVTPGGVLAKMKMFEAAKATEIKEQKKIPKSPGQDSDSSGSRSNLTTTNTAKTGLRITDNKHNSIASYDCVWPEDVSAASTPHIDVGVYNLATSIPRQDVAPQYSSASSSTTAGTTTSTQDIIYHVPVSSAKNHALPNNITVDNIDGAVEGGLYYLSSAVPVFEDPWLNGTASIDRSKPATQPPNSSTASKIKSTNKRMSVGTQGKSKSEYYIVERVQSDDERSEQRLDTTRDDNISGKTVLSSTSSSSSTVVYSTNRGVKSGLGDAVPVGLPMADSPRNKNADFTDSSDYSKLDLNNEHKVSGTVKQRLADRGYGSLASLAMKSGDQVSLASRRTRRSIEEDADTMSSFDWGSEFDDDDEEGLDLDEVDKMLRQMDQEAEAADDAYSALNPSALDEAPDKPLPPKPQKLKAFSPKSFFQGQAGKTEPAVPESLSTFYRTVEGTSGVDDISAPGCLPVYINPDKHPPPELPQEPEGLSENQKKRRLIIDLIISSERSYLESLERVIKEYERAILEHMSAPQSAVRPVFTEMREIICHHKMFQIELAESVKNWDRDEKIGDIFTASFSKAMLVRCYSVFVNNFAQAMEEIKSLRRTRPQFDEFLRNQEKLSADRLPIFALMVKPVQRFPQFIMVLQDLIKYTPTSHHDQHALQLALTELENVAHKLNERKRNSEQKFQACQLTQSLARQKMYNLLTVGGAGAGLVEQDVSGGGTLTGLVGGTSGSGGVTCVSQRRLIRSDDVQQVFGEFGTMKCKPRRLILMNDLVICVKVITKEQGRFKVEKFDLKWIAKLSDLELKDTAVAPDMKKIMRREPGKIHLMSAQMDKPEDDPFHLLADLREMLHDYSVIEQAAKLLATLKRSYLGHGLKEELFHEVMDDLENMIHIKDEQLRVVDSCTLQLVNHSKSEKPTYVIQTSTASVKQDWCTDLLLAKLALEKSNKPAWDIPTSSDDAEFDVVPAQFMKHVVVDRPKNYTKIQCASSIFLHPGNSPFGVGVQHLWVCSSTSTHGQVSVLSIHNSKPALIESFKACNCDIMAAELVPGCGQVTSPEQYMFSQDTVWVATAHREILIFPLSSEDGVRRDPLAVWRTPAVTISLMFVDERLFCGFANGAMHVFSRVSDGSWSVVKPTQLTYGSSPVKLHFVHEEDVWLSCGMKLYTLEIDSLESLASHTLSSTCHISHVVKAGLGIWVSFQNSAYIKLYHLETMEIVQEVSVRNFVSRIGSEKLKILSSSTDDVVVTCLTESKGLLWIGTSVGVVLTLPLPRLSNGVPFYRGQPNISLHTHRGPVKFLVALHCSSSTLEMKRSSTLHSTLQQRPSRRNIEREMVELEESQQRREAESGQETVRKASNTVKRRSIILDTVPDGAMNNVSLVNDESDGSEYVDVDKLDEGRRDKNKNILKTNSEENSQADIVTSSSHDGAATHEKNADLSTQPQAEACSFDESDSTETYCNFKYRGATLDRNFNSIKSKIDAKFNMKYATARYSRHESMDDTNVVSMRKGVGKALSFRSELARRIQKTTERISQSQWDLSTYQNEVELYYDALLEDGATQDDGEDAADEENIDNTSITLNLSKKNVKKESRKHFKTPFFKDKSKKDKVKQDLTTQSTSDKKSTTTNILPTITSKSGVSPSSSSASSSSKASGGGDDSEFTTAEQSSKEGNSEQHLQTVSSPLSSLSKQVNNQKIGSQFRGSPGRGATVRKGSANSAVIVLSGGDGYCDLDQSRSQFKTEDACVQLWLYKY